MKKAIVPLAALEADGLDEADADGLGDVDAAVEADRDGDATGAADDDAGAALDACGEHATRLTAPTQTSAMIRWMCVFDARSMWPLTAAP